MNEVADARISILCQREKGVVVAVEHPRPVEELTLGTLIVVDVGIFHVMCLAVDQDDDVDKQLEHVLLQVGTIYSRNILNRSCV